MSSTDVSTPPAAEVLGALAELKTLLVGLSDRVGALEERVAGMPNPAREVSPAVLAVISAACAAYLGQRATIKQVHLRRDSTWRRQGRSDVQHSHNISHGRR
ncbi:MAG TPA: hypothetical protein VES01_07575 [Dermatophilaceae bacterium]|nr:hypothetical protein [Dermatophilaceae bacterium]